MVKFYLTVSAALPLYESGFMGKIQLPKESLVMCFVIISSSISENNIQKLSHREDLNGGSHIFIVFNSFICKWDPRLVDI